MATVAATKPTETPDEQTLREDLAAAYRLVAHFGWDELIFTHLSLRIPGPDHHFLINPLGLLFEEITASSLVKIDLQGRPLGDNTQPVNPAGFVIHSAVHAAREDAQCVMHLHTVAGTAVAAQRDGLLPLSQNALLGWDDLAYHDYEGLAVETGEKERLVADLGTHNLMILRNHGLLTVGATVADAFVRMFILQRACEMQVAAQAGGAPLIHQSDAMGHKVAAQGRAAFAAGAGLSWAALRRKLDRLDPDYRA
ncbi:class II aldolase [Rhodothalassium salexigens]|uniref:class II aldolase/adducin family protein n=1 Tax=Rhodothalassium salexigens TaxID=1086 RepID=UPI001913D568|nr:class II aldolase/adducin family protein [Rhodothalassium salexigens]MBK5910739.1 class II aldolase [Rhodothalassium salexigens]MBK5919811.1 class II aldolase [Rhodothalassium salexigens]